MLFMVNRYMKLIVKKLQTYFYLHLLRFFVTVNEIKIPRRLNWLKADFHMLFFIMTDQKEPIQFHYSLVQNFLSITLQSSKYFIFRLYKSWLFFIQFVHIKKFTEEKNFRNFNQISMIRHHHIINPCFWIILSYL